MTREEAKELLPIIQAWTEGKNIQFKNTFGAWIDIPNNGKVCFDECLTEFRIKPEPKYRPFKTQEECWQEMLKHQPFGWVRSTISDNLYLIEYISDDIDYNRTFAFYNEAFEWVKFADGTPFGVMEE